MLGGFHLAPHKEEYVKETVMALKEISPDYIIPMHCTGERIYEIAKSEMPERLLAPIRGPDLYLMPEPTIEHKGGPLIPPDREKHISQLGSADHVHLHDVIPPTPG